MAGPSFIPYTVRSTVHISGGNLGGAGGGGGAAAPPHSWKIAEFSEILT